MEYEISNLENDSSQKDLVCQQLSNLDLHLATTDIEVDTSDAIKLPFDQIPALGVALGSLPEVFRSVTTQINIPTLLQATDRFGNRIDPSILHHFKDGSGLLGSYTDATNELHQARFQQVELGSIQTVTTMPYDPTVLFVAMALAQINQKLDSIQDTVDDILEYLVQKDKAELRGNLKTLESALEAYRFNWNNKTWLNNTHMKVCDIQQASEQSIIHLRQQIRKKLTSKGAIEIRLQTGKRLDEILDRLKEYQLAVYIWSFASFLEPMLSENFNEEYLDSIASKIRERGIAYRELYTECYNAIEENAGRSADSFVLGGVSTALTSIGSLIEKTPLGDISPVDEALQDAGKNIQGLNNEYTQALMQKLIQAKTPNVTPFRESLEAVNRAHNQPLRLAADNESIYLLND